jgi:hypothetical protein
MNTIILLLFGMIILLILVILLLSIVVVRQSARVKAQQKRIDHFTFASRKSLPLQNTKSVIEEIPGDQSKKSVGNELIPAITDSPLEYPRQKRSLTNVDEEHKYTESRSGEPKWYMRDTTKMILPLQSDQSQGVDLEMFPGNCKIYVNGKHSWTSNVCDMMSAHALWRAAQKHRQITVEPERLCPVVSIGNH